MKRILHTGLPLLLLLMVWMAFSPALRNDFVAFDDDHYVYDNPAISSGLTVQGLKWVLTHSHAGNWHPLTSLSHMLDCQIYGLKPLGHHLTSLLIHAAVTLLLFSLLQQMTGSIWQSALATAFFAVHPLRVESVVWISERKDVLSGLFFMLTLLAYLRFIRRPPSWRRHLPMMALFFAGLMSKSMLVTLPFVLLVLDFWPLHRFPPWSMPGSSTSWTLLIKEKIPLFALSFLFCAITLLAQDDAVASTDHLSLFARVSNALVSYVTYLKQWVWPRDLTAFYPFPKDPLTLSMVAGAAFFIACITLAVWFLRRQQPWALTGWLWYIGMLVPAIGIVQVGGQAHADRYTYLPMIGIGIATIWTIAPLCTGRIRRIAAGTIAAALLVALVILSRAQTEYWKDSNALWTRAIACTERNYVAWNGLGRVAFEDNNLLEAESCFQRAITINPRYVEAQNGMGVTLFADDRPAEAELFLQQVVTLMPSFDLGYLNLGQTLIRQNKHKEAAAAFQKALEINPKHVEACIYLGDVLLRQYQWAEAISIYEDVLDLQPNHTVACNNLAWILSTAATEQHRDGQRAVVLARNANRLTGGSNVVMLQTLAAAYAECARFAEAISTLQRAIQLSGDPEGSINQQIQLYESGQRIRNP